MKIDHFELFNKTPMICGHEHWGIFGHLWREPGGCYMVDRHAGQSAAGTTLFDLMLDPYFSALCLRCGGFRLLDEIRDAGFVDVHAIAVADPERLLRIILPAIKLHRLTGTWQCLRKGIMALYDYDINDLEGEGWQAINNRVQSNYNDIFAWHAQGMRKLNIKKICRPVNLEFFRDPGDAASAQAERLTMCPILRIDDFCRPWQATPGQRAQWREMTGYGLGDADEYRKFLAAAFALARTRGAVGIKQLQAYSRPLDFQKRSDNEVTWGRDNLTKTEEIIFSDWVMHECCALANDYGWPHQVHVGTHNLPDSSPLPLRKLVGIYTNVRFVLLHTWPYIEESGFLAKNCYNVYVDPCWLAVLNRQFLKNALDAWLGYLPLHKIMLSHDATSLEMAAGSHLTTHQLLVKCLREQASDNDLPDGMIENAATFLLYQNAATVYGIDTD